METDPSKKVFLISGSIGQGKTTQIQKIVATLKAQNIAVGGIISPRVMEQETTIGYDIVDVKTQQRVAFLRKTSDENLSRIGQYSILPQGLETGINALAISRNSKNDVVLIDEVGKLELGNQGWAKSLGDLISHSNCHLLLSVRDAFIDQVIQKWDLKNWTVFNVSEQDSHVICNSITIQIKGC